MALLWIEGFDAFTNVTQARKSLWIPTTAGITFETGRDDRGKALRIANSGSQYRLAFAPNAANTYVLGFAFKFNPVTATILCRVIGERTTELELELTAAGELKLDRGSFTQIDITSGLGLSTDTWYYIEFKFKIDNSTGLYDVKVGGASVMSGTNVDTKASTSTGRGGPYTIQFLGRSGATFWDYDDIYLLDTTGTDANDFLGDSIVEAVYPTGDGTTNDFTPLSGLTNYEMVDDGDNPDDGTTYVSSSTVNHSELYTHGGLQETVDTIYGVRVDANMWVSSPGPRQVRAYLRSGGVNYEGDNLGCAASYKYVHHVWELDPNTAVRWTESGVNNAEFGMTIEA